MTDRIKLYIMVVAFALSVGSMLVAVGQTNKTVKTNEVKVTEFDKRLDQVERMQEGDGRDLKHVKEGVDKNAEKLDKILDKLNH